MKKTVGTFLLGSAAGSFFGAWAIYMGVLTHTVAVAGLFFGFLGACGLALHAANEES